MFCAISGTSPLHPVVSVKSGHVYEKDLILKYLNDNEGKDPMTGEALEEKDLIEVKTVPASPSPPPRPPSLTSIPSLIHALQNEWDASMLESLSLRQQNASLRQELSHALYKEDAAMRVLARVMRERDEAREALGSVNISLGQGQGQAADGGDVEMEPVKEEGGMSAAVIERIDTTSAALSVTRKKRKAPAGYATPATVKTYAPQSTIPSMHSTKPPGITTLTLLGADSSLLLTGGMDKTVQLYNRSTDKVICTLKGHTKKINAVAATSRKTCSAEALPGLVIAGSADKTVRVWAPTKGGKAVYAIAGTLSDHQGEVTGVSVHPSDTLLLSSSLDGTWALHDLAHPSGKPTTLITVSLPESEAPTGTGLTTVEWHPDGQILATGATDGKIRLYDVKTAQCVATFPGHGVDHPIKSLSFSENGYTLASIATTSAEVKLWDLRKMTNTHTITVPVEEISELSCVQWDFSAQFLSVVGKGGLKVWVNKTWEEVMKLAVEGAEVTGVDVGEGGKEWVVGGMDRTVRVVGPPPAAATEA